MGNDSGALVLLIVLIVSAFLLFVIKFAQFVNYFSREKQHLLTEMSRAADYNEDRYWRRELRCLYLCLISFVTERNVMKVCPVFFRRAKHATKEKRSDGLMHILAPSVISIFICAVCLCGVSWAWFTASTSTGTTQIQSSSYKLSYQIGSNTAELAKSKTVTVPESGSCKITLSAGGTSGATGYCSVKIGDETYYTEQIFANGTFTFTVKEAAGTQITLTPQWGTYSHNATLRNGAVITVTGSQQNNTQAPDNTVTTVPSTEPSTEPAPTTPTTPTTPTAPPAPTTPSSTPAESATTTPEPSATAPAATQPETTDTEPSPAPETATPENTTAAQTEPSTTEESEATE